MTTMMLIRPSEVRNHVIYSVSTLSHGPTSVSNDANNPFGWRSLTLSLHYTKHVNVYFHIIPYENKY